jgi:hypothetical protein
MKLSPIGLGALGLLAGWFGLDFVGLGGVVDREPLVSLAGLMLGILILAFAASIVRLRFTAPVFGLALLVWAALQIETHWSSYLFGASDGKLAWYERVFGDEWSFLPPIAGHPTPDGYHTVLFALILLNLVLVLRDLLGVRRS